MMIMEHWHCLTGLDYSNLNLNDHDDWRNVHDDDDDIDTVAHVNILLQDGFLPNGETTLHTRELVIPSISKVLSFQKVTRASA